MFMFVFTYKAQMSMKMNIRGCTSVNLYSNGGRELLLLV